MFCSIKKTLFSPFQKRPKLAIIGHLITFYSKFKILKMCKSYVFQEDFQALVTKNTIELSKTFAKIGATLTQDLKEEIISSAIETSEEQYEQNMLRYCCTSGFIGEERVKKFMELTGCSYDWAQEAVTTFR